MTIDATQIAADLAFIQSDLADTDCSESVTVYEPDGSTVRGTAVELLRASVLRGTELENTGWASQYKISVYVIATNDPGVQVDDVVSMSDAKLRVLNIHAGPLTLCHRLDLGGLYGDET